jgi:hypothetical protein
MGDSERESAQVLTGEEADEIARAEHKQSLIQIHDISNEAKD